MDAGLRYPTYGSCPRSDILNPALLLDLALIHRDGRKLQNGCSLIDPNMTEQRDRAIRRTTFLRRTTLKLVILMIHALAIALSHSAISSMCVCLSCQP